MGLHLLKPYAESKYTMKSYKASDLFSIKIDQLATFPLNVEFIVKPHQDNFQGPGIYFMCYKNELVYIGSFYSSEKNNDVRSQRWDKELATISMRGNQIKFNKAGIDALNNQQAIVIQSPIILNGNFLTSVKRIEFASKNWSFFKQDDFLKDFCFCWMPLDSKLKRSKKQLEAMTAQLRNFYKPSCNG
jgi:hypothetical protein